MGKRTPNSFFQTARRAFEHHFVTQMIAACGNKMEASRRLGISYATLKMIVKAGPPKVTGEHAAFIDELKESLWKRLGGTAKQANDELGDLVSGLRAELRAELVKTIHRQVDLPAAGRRHKKAA